MAVNLATAQKANDMQNLIDAIDGKTYVTGSGTGAAGQLVIGTSALSGATGVLATIPLSLPSGTKSGAVMTLSGTPLSVNPSAGGTAAKAEFRNSSGTTIVDSLTVGTSGADIIVNTTTVAVGIPFQINSGTITHG